MGLSSFCLLFIVLVSIAVGGSSKSQSDLDYVYFHGNSTSETVFRDFNRRNIKFILYNRARPNGYRLTKNAVNFRKSGFDIGEPTKFLVHGYMGNCRSDSVQMTKNAYMTTGNYNVIAVDWSEYNFPYAVAVNSVREVGHTISDMIRFLRLRPSEAHIVGHSLGAHVAGFAGKSVRNWLKSRGQANAKIGRITGLDPAAPAFAGNPANGRLDAGDAQFVDVMHTSIQLLGMAKRIGHADFYPNGGSRQPPCIITSLEPATGLCDHSQSYVYFSQSIRDRHRYPAVSCTSAVDAIGRRCPGGTMSYMGEDAVNGPGGVYYVSVNHQKRKTPTPPTG